VIGVAPRFYLFSRGGLKAGEAFLQRLAVLVDGVLGEAVTQTCHVLAPVVLAAGTTRERGDTYAFSRVVLRKVALQVWHWMSLAASFCRDCGQATALSAGGVVG